MPGRCNVFAAFYPAATKRLTMSVVGHPNDVEPISISDMDNSNFFLVYIFFFSTIIK